MSPRASGIIAVLGFLLHYWFAATVPRPEDGPAEPRERARPDVAGPGYIPAGAPMEPPPAPPPRKGARPIDFALLSGYDYDPEADLIPEEVLALDGRLVELRGVMYYAVEDLDHVEDFFLMPNHMVCCFGVPRTNEFVRVVLAPGRATQYVLNYYLVRGRLEVGTVRDEFGRVEYLYAISDAEAEVME